MGNCRSKQATEKPKKKAAKKKKYEQLGGDAPNAGGIGEDLLSVSQKGPSDRELLLKETPRITPEAETNAAVFKVPSVEKATAETSRPPSADLSPSNQVAPVGAEPTAAAEKEPLSPVQLEPHQRQVAVEWSKEKEEDDDAEGAEEREAVEVNLDDDIQDELDNEDDDDDDDDDKEKPAFTLPPSLLNYAMSSTEPVASPESSRFLNPAYISSVSSSSGASDPGLSEDGSEESEETEEEEVLAQNEASVPRTDLSDVQWDFAADGLIPTVISRQRGVSPRVSPKSSPGGEALSPPGPTMKNPGTEIVLKEQALVVRDSEEIIEQTDETQVVIQSTEETSTSIVPSASRAVVPYSLPDSLAVPDVSKKSKSSKSSQSKKSEKSEATSSRKDSLEDDEDSVLARMARHFTFNMSRLAASTENTKALVALDDTEVDIPPASMFDTSALGIALPSLISFNGAAAPTTEAKDEAEKGKEESVVSTVDDEASADVDKSESASETKTDASPNPADHEKEAESSTPVVVSRAVPLVPDVAVSTKPAETSAPAAPDAPTPAPAPVAAHAPAPVPAADTTPASAPIAPPAPVETSAPAVETSAPAVETSAPAVETSAPAVETSAPAVETSAPAPAPVETSAPAPVAAPAPVEKAASSPAPVSPSESLKLKSSDEGADTKDGANEGDKKDNADVDEVEKFRNDIESDAEIDPPKVSRELDEVEKTRLAEDELDFDKSKTSSESTFASTNRKQINFLLRRRKVGSPRNRRALVVGKESEQEATKSTEVEAKKEAASLNTGAIIAIDDDEDRVDEPYEATDDHLEHQFDMSEVITESRDDSEKSGGRGSDEDSQLGFEVPLRRTQSEPTKNAEEEAIEMQRSKSAVPNGLELEVLEEDEGYDDEEEDPAIFEAPYDEKESANSSSNKSRSKAPDLEIKPFSSDDSGQMNTKRTVRKGFLSSHKRRMARRRIGGGAATTP